MKGFPDLPPLWLALGLVLAWAMAAWLPLAHPFGDLAQAFGIVLMLGGVVAIGWSAWWFWHKRTTIEPHHDPQVLIVEGPYRISRNPIYLGMVSILAGAVLWMAALGPVWVPPAFAWVLRQRFILPEEAALRRQFGEHAERYLAATRRWI